MTTVDSGKTSAPEVGSLTGLSRLIVGTVVDCFKTWTLEMESRSGVVSYNRSRRKWPDNVDGMKKPEMGFP